MTDNDSGWARPPEHSLSKFGAELDGVLKRAEYNEIYGLTLVPPTEGEPCPHTTMIILQKFLRANQNDVAAAKTQLEEALKWRKSYRPQETLRETFMKSKFDGLGYVTSIEGAKETGNKSDVATFNVYGAAAKDPKKAFGDTDAFVRWRVALMELTLQRLDLPNCKAPIPDYGEGKDPAQAIQVHDYLSVSFFRQPSEIKAASSKIIDMFQRYYPETVSYKYFVNVPIVMQWMMGAMKMLMSKDSIQKMTWMTYGESLVQYDAKSMGRRVLSRDNAAHMPSESRLRHASWPPLYLGDILTLLPIDLGIWGLTFLRSTAGLAKNWQVMLLQ